MLIPKYLSLMESHGLKWAERLSAGCAALASTRLRAAAPKPELGAMPVVAATFSMPSGEWTGTVIIYYQGNNNCISIDLFFL